MVLLELTSIDELFKDKDHSRIDQADVSQVACTVLQLGLVDLLSSFGVRPASVVGHSSGEIAAAYAAGAVAFEDCILLAYYRGQAVLSLKERFPKVQGSMLAVGMGFVDMSRRLKELASIGVSVACVNSPASVTISGDEASIAKISRSCDDDGIFNRKLRTNVAYHSSHMTLVAESYYLDIKHLKHGKPSGVEFFSSLTGAKISTSELDGEYWMNNMISPVMFSKAMESICASNHPDVLLELGPHSALQGPIHQTLDGIVTPSSRPESLYTLVRYEDSHAMILQTAAKLFLKGCILDMTEINFPKRDAPKPSLLLDLPTYPWNHSQRYELESRIAWAYENPQSERHDLLGIRIPGGNDLEPQWRNILRTESLPWLLQHKIRENIVFPASGYVSIAIEATRWYNRHRGLNASRYCLREVVLSRALKIPHADEVEIAISLRRANQGTKTSSRLWNEIRIGSWTPDRQFVEHFQCLTSTGDVASSTVNFQPKFKSRTTDIRDEILRDAQVDLDANDMYEAIGQTDLQFGPLFQGLEDVKFGSDYDSATASLSPRITKAAMPYQTETDLVIHPVTLDMCFQGTWPILTKGSTLTDELYVPTYIKRLEIAANICEKGVERLRVLVRRSSSPTLANEHITDLYVERNGEANDGFACQAENMTVTGTGKNHNLKQEVPLTFQMAWEPWTRSLTSKQFRHLYPQNQLTQDSFCTMAAIERAALIFAERAVQQIDLETVSEMAEHHQKYFFWLETRAKQGIEASSVLRDSRASEIMSKREDELIEYARNKCGADGRLSCKIGEDLIDILKGKTAPLTLMLEDGLLGESYRTGRIGERTHPDAARYVGLMAHQNPHLKILEVGAGTCGTTVALLPQLAGAAGGNPRFSKYVCTDISTGFFDEAKKVLQPWTPMLDFERLDIEFDPCQQGFVEAEFDLVIASNVLHATKSMQNTIQNVRKLLKPSGSLLLIELTKTTLQNFAFGTLPGWWLGAS